MGFDLRHHPVLGPLSFAEFSSSQLLPLKGVFVLAVGIYHGRMSISDPVSFDIPDVPMLNPVPPDEDIPDPGIAHPLAESLVALHFNRTNTVLYLIRGPALYLYDNHPSLVRLPDHTDTTIVRDLPQATRTNIQNFLTAAQINLTTAQRNRLAALPWNQALRRLVRRLINPVCTPDDIVDWLRKDGNLQYVDIPHDGGDFDT